MTQSNQQGLGLSQDAKERLRAEEIFRAEVRRQIAATTGPRKLHQKLWAARNSAFALWLLSSVLLAAISWGYTQWEGARGERRQAELDYRELAVQAAGTLDELQGAIIAIRSSVEQHLQEVIRRLGRFHFRFAMTEEFKASTTAQPDSATSFKEARDRMKAAGSAAEGAFRLWVESARGDDVDARKKWLEDWRERSQRHEEDTSRALSRRDKQDFFLIEEAIKSKVLLRDYGEEMERLADSAARNRADLISAAKGFAPLSGVEPWLAEEPSPVWQRVGEYRFWPELMSAVESGLNLRMRFGEFEDLLGLVTLSKETDKATLDKAIFGLAQLELAYAKLFYARQERERVRLAAIADSMQSLFDAVRAAEALMRTVMNELSGLQAGRWSRDISEIPRHSQTLKQRVRYALTPRGDVPDDIVELEKEAETEIAQSWAYLERVLGLPGKP